jgi:hypothetical protein
MKSDIALPIREPETHTGLSNGLNKGETAMLDVLIIVGFWAMILAPCLVALHTGAHLDTEDAG